jgi:hypothetical protein
MSLQIVRFTTAQDQLAEAEKGIERLFSAVHAAAPGNLRYLAARAEDRPDFQLMLHLTAGAPNPLLAIPEALSFRTAMAEWAVAPPAPLPMTVLGDYRMLG